MGLLLASAAAVAYQGVQQRAFSRSMIMEARLRGGVGPSPPPPPPPPTRPAGASSSGGNYGHKKGDNSAKPPLATNASSPSMSSEMITLSDDPNWLDMTDFDVYLDAFSDSWYMSTSLFLQSKSRIDDIDGVEEACFLMFDKREDKVRMSLDWLDCAVEHMSKWWRTAEAPQNQVAHRIVVNFLRRYATRVLESTREADDRDRGPLRPTVAVIAFQAYTEPGADEDAGLNERCRELTVASLAATLSSLVHVGMGRILVVGHDLERASEQPQVLEALDWVSAQASASSAGGGNEPPTPFNERNIRGSRLVYVTVPTDLVRTDFAGVNLPRGALLGLHRAFAGGDAAWTNAWLGEAPARTDPASLYHFVYLTEPDTLLHTRPRTLATMARMMRDGLILAPHRLQPIPYQSDFSEAAISKNALLPEEQLTSSPFPTITTLDEARDACCDDQMGVHRPGSHDATGSHCGDFWWRCGFLSQGAGSGDKAGNHSRILDHYRLVRLQQGTGVTTLAGSEHGRRCTPVVDGTCRRKTKDVPKDLRRPRYPFVTPSKEKSRRNSSLAGE